MLITKIVRKGVNVEIHLEDGNKFLVTDDIVLSKGLRKEDELDESTLNEIEIESELLRVKDSALRLLSRRNHSKYELKLKLLKKKFSKEVIQKVLVELEDKDLLNDEQFARELVDERLNRKNEGINKIRNSLFQKGVNREIIDKVLDSKLDEETMVESALKLASKRLKLLDKLDDSQKKKQKIYSYLANKGYSFDQIKLVIEKLNL